ncbi:MAG: hypothetical protein Q4E28_01610 [Clostridia bacterium]|nr:hypothetical protein [Clostridia bacterium]
MKERQKPIAALAVFIVTIIINLLGVFGVFNSTKMTDLFKEIPSFIAPASGTFVLLPIIYLLVLVALILPIIKSSDYNTKVADSVSMLFIGASLLSIAFTFSFVYRQLEIAAIFSLAIVVIFGMLINKLNKVHEKKHFFHQLAFGLHFGWDFIFTFIVVGFMIINWDSSLNNGGNIWAGIALTIIVLLVLLSTFLLTNVAIIFPVVIVISGIYSNLLKTEYKTLQTFCLVSIAVLIIAFLIRLYMNHFKIVKEKDVLEEEDELENVILP